MSKRCPYCKSRNVVMHVDPPSAQDIEQYENLFIEPVEVPYKCNECGMIWTEVLGHNPEESGANNSQ